MGKYDGTNGIIYADNLPRRTFLDRMEEEIKTRYENGELVIPKTDLLDTPGWYFKKKIQEAFWFLYGKSMANTPYVHSLDNIHEEVNLRLAFAMTLGLECFRTPESTAGFIREANFNANTKIKYRYSYILLRLRPIFINAGLGWDGQTLTTEQTYQIEYERQSDIDAGQSRADQEKEYYPAHWWIPRVSRQPKNDSSGQQRLSFAEGGGTVNNRGLAKDWERIDAVIAGANAKFQEHGLGPHGPAEVQRLKGIFLPGQENRLREYFEKSLEKSFEINAVLKTLGIIERPKYVQQLNDEGFCELENKGIWRPLKKPKPKTKAEEILQNIEAWMGPQRFAMWFMNANITVEESRVVFYVSRLAVDTISKKYRTEISASIEAVLGESRPFFCEGKKKEQPQHRSDPPEPLPPPKVLAPVASEATPLGNVLSGIVGAY
jgi:hypothetical protein